MKKQYLIIFLFFLITANYSSYCVLPSVLRLLSFREDLSDLIHNNPPLSVSMPYDIMEGYLTYYNISTKVKYNDYEAYLNSLPAMTDSIRSLFSYYYKLQDYNPILLFKYNQSDLIDSSLIYPPYKLESDLEVFLINKLKYPLDIVLFRSYIILDVKVVDNFYDEYNETLTVTSSIVDTIKGKVIPTCKDARLPIDTTNFPANYHDTIPHTQLALPGTCFEFLSEYNVGAYKPNIQNDSEYIIFCYINPIGWDSKTNNVYYAPYILNSDNNPMWEIFPVSNGMVIDSFNEIGFGKEVAVDLWKQQLRQRIDEIKNGLPPTDVIDAQPIDIGFNIYPNPVDDKFTIKFNQLFSSENVSVEIYSLLGEKMNAGYEIISPITIETNTRNLNPGVYLCVVRTPDRKYCKTIEVIR